MNSSESAISEATNIAASNTPFVPKAQYNRTSGWIEYANLNASYTAERISDRFELLWHPEKPEAVGVKLFVGSPTDILKCAAYWRADPNIPIPLNTFLLSLRAEIEGPKTEAERLISKFYSIGEAVVGDVTLAAEEWQERIQPVAIYNEPSDSILFIRSDRCENSLYTSESVDGVGVLLILWHPHRQEIIGARICSIRYYSDRDPQFVPPDDPNAPLALSTILVPLQLSPCYKARETSPALSFS
jgi:hypothetical protein